MIAAYSELKACRASGSSNLISVLDLGKQALTGVFPESSADAVTSGPLEIVWCPDSGLVQLAHTYDPVQMYGDNYGYRSGLNQSMIDHLTAKVGFLQQLAKLEPGDVVVDIGSNDATTLQAYTVPNLRRIGIDPTGTKFRQYYPDEIRLVPDFFSAKAYRDAESRRARIVTSIAMFYDLDAPVEFARQIAEVLTPDGIWHLEQSYLPSMLRLNSYDTICHEHLEYYSLRVLKKILEDASLKIVDVTTNAVNGGSIAVTATHGSNSAACSDPVVEWMLEQEERMGLQTARPYREFEERVFRHRADLTRLIRGLNAEGRKVYGYGASTKGNVVLQFCGFTQADIPAIVEINPEKFGRVTPGTHIPIISEAQASKEPPDYYLVLPWHFRDGILRRERDFVKGGGKFIFPFPEIEVV